MPSRAAERIFTILDEKPAVVDKPEAKAMTEIKGGLNSTKSRMNMKTACLS
jgi:hypothetical protein